MDIFGYMNNRNVDIGGIFSQELVTNTQDMHSLMKQLRVWWDIATLEMYVSEKMTPRRLRWDLNPNDSIDDTGLMEEWYSFFNKCENELLQNIVKRRQYKLKLIEASIAEIKTLLPFTNHKEYKDKEKRTPRDKRDNKEIRH